MGYVLQPFYFYSCFTPSMVKQQPHVLKDEEGLYIHPYKEGIVPKLKASNNASLRAFQTPSDCTLYHGATKINQFQPLTQKPSSLFIRQGRQALQKSALAPAKFISKAPSNWPKSRIEGSSLSDLESDELLIQAWKTSLSVATIQALVNRYMVLKGPVVEKTKKFQIVVKKSTALQH